MCILDQTYHIILEEINEDIEQVQNAQELIHHVQQQEQYHDMIALNIQGNLPRQNVNMCVRWRMCPVGTVA